MRASTCRWVTSRRRSTRALEMPVSGCFCRASGSCSALIRLLCNSGCLTSTYRAAASSERRCKHPHASQIIAMPTATHESRTRLATSRGIVRAQGTRPVPRRSTARNTVTATKARSRRAARCTCRAIRLTKPTIIRWCVEFIRTRSLSADASSFACRQGRSLALLLTAQDLHHLFVVFGFEPRLGFQAFANQPRDPSTALFQDQIDHIATDDATQFGEQKYLQISHNTILNG